MYVLRPYQQTAVDLTRDYFLSKSQKKPVLLIEPTGCGKSLIIANVAQELDAPLLVFQPTKEILQQNYDKLNSYGTMGVTVYSASMRQKEIGNITLATIGSVYRKPELFKQYKYILIDEADLCNAKAGVYKQFIEAVGEKHCGMTATPYRMNHDGYGGTMMKFLTRTNPRIFSRVLHVTQTRDLLSQGYLAKTDYFPINGFTRSAIKLNSTGADYNEPSEREYYDKTSFDKRIIKVVKRLLEIGKTRILVFTKFVHEAETLAQELGECASVVHGEMNPKERDIVIKGFRSGKIKVVTNCAVLTAGFDYPELEVVVVARPTRSLRLWYQMCLDMETEILTKRGFLKHADIRDTDIVASFDNRNIVWSKINEIFYRPIHEGEKFISFKNQHLDFRVTDNHTMLAQSCGMKVFQKESALEMTTRTTMFHVPVSGIEDKPDCWLSDDEVKFLGLFLSDGSLGKVNNAIAIVQSLSYPYIIKEIERVLISCGLKYGKVLNKRKGLESKYNDTFHFTISKGKPRGSDKDKKGWAYISDFIDKDLSEAYELLSARQFAILLDGIYLGDGKKYTSDSYKVASYTLCMGDNKTYTDRIQSLCLRRGFRCNLYTQKKDGFHDQYILHVKPRTTSTIAGINVTNNVIKKKPVKRSRLQIENTVANQEFVWCVNTDIGTIVTRRNGKALIVGNSGRVVRPDLSEPTKVKMVVDMCNNYEVFGGIADMEVVERDGDNLWAVMSRGKQLTNKYLDEITKD